MIITAILLQACSLGSLLPNINFCANVYIWLIAMATKMPKFRKIFKHYMWDKAETLLKCSQHYRLQKYCLLQLLQHFCCYANLKFQLTYNRKCEKWHLLLSDCRYFDKTFSKCFLGSHLPNIQLLCELLCLIDGNNKAKIWEKNIKKPTPRKLYSFILQIVRRPTIIMQT